MNHETLTAVAALAKSTALVNYKGSMGIDVTRYTSSNDTEGVLLTVRLHGRDGVDYARSNGVAPGAWYSDDRPQRSYDFQEDGVHIVVIELAPIGSKLVGGQLVLPEAVQ